MHTNNETRAVTAGLACLCALGAFTAVLPILAYVLLGLLALGAAGLTIGGMRLWRATRYQPGQTTSRRASQDVAGVAPVVWQEVA